VKITRELVEYVLREILSLLIEIAQESGENVPVFSDLDEMGRKQRTILAVVLNEVIIGRFVNTQSCPHTGKIARGTTGMTTLESAKATLRRGECKVIKYTGIFIDEQLLYKMQAFLHGTYEELFSERSLDKICVAANFDGLLGFLNCMEPGDFPHHW
jgi:5S rRNA maturation endonuclease (ribonuclease M5)